MSDEPKQASEILARDKAVCDAATEGPWQLMPPLCGPDGCGCYGTGTLDPKADDIPVCEVADPYPRGDNRPQENMEFIAAARTGWPRAIAAAHKYGCFLGALQLLLAAGCTVDHEELRVTVKNAGDEYLRILRGEGGA